MSAYDRLVCGVIIVVFFAVLIFAPYPVVGAR